VVGQPPRGGEVVVALPRTHEQDVADVRKTLAATAVGLEVPSQAEIEPRQVADHRIVLGVCESAHRDVAGIAGVRLHGLPQPRLDPAMDHLSLAGGKWLASTTSRTFCHARKSRCTSATVVSCPRSMPPPTSSPE